MESTQDQLKRIKATLAPDEWRDVRIYRHNDVEFEHITLIATQVSSNEIYYYDPDADELKPLNVSGRRTPA
ncbi:MAG: hypothetical protein CMJ45_01915 [Planctomyces sp.]|jgi:hypothetical protein|nr:hypothetical protein [Planctomyces sp.]